VSLTQERALSDHVSPIAGGDTDPSGSRRLLLLDDDDALCRTIARMGAKLGAKVAACSTLTEFEEMLASFSPDVLLIDLMMPDVDGIDVIARLGPHCTHAIYVMSGADKRTLEASREVLRASGAQIAGYIQKPFSAADLRHLLEQPRAETPVNRSNVEKEGAVSLLSPAAFDKAARSGKIGPFFQPIFHADGRTLKGFEALLRINGRDDNHFAPEYLELLINDNELSNLLTDIVIERSLEFLASLITGPNLSVSINIFGSHALADGFREHLLQRCAHHHIAPGRVILELNEATVFDFNDEDLRKITQLRLAGFGLSIDDLGTGNSSLGRLASLPFSELKIDKSFCLALPGSEPAEAVIEACLSIARKLDMSVTAEGVETREVADLLARMGCHALQGHWFGRAMAADEAVDWVCKGAQAAAG
jgi:EAL domain-containing protein (putative c-di-GMP-specific phosphodiesterase class I)/FixJ family two-component response regulator